jgi:hypothetical protein
MSFGIPVRNGLAIGLLSSTFLSTGRAPPPPPPALDLNFLAGAPLDSRITFTRSTTATFVGSNGLIQTAAIDVPRFDYDPVTLAPKGFLIETGRANLLTYSAEFENAAWTKTNADNSIANATTAPDGTVTGFKHVPNAGVALGIGASETRVQQNGSATIGLNYTFSIYAKAGEFDQIEFALLATPTVTAIFSLTLGTVVSGTNASITPAGNGWYRCVFTVVAGATGALSARWSAQSSLVSDGDGTSGIFAWGAQLEATFFASSYYPTVASTSPARGTDSAVMTGTNFSSWYSATEGTFVASASVLVTTGNRGIYTASDGTNTNRIYLNLTNANPANANHFIAAVTVGTQAEVITSAPISPNTVFRDAFAYRENDVNGATNGVLGTADTSVTLPVVDQFRIGARGDNGNRIEGHVRTITYYASRLTDAQLRALST